MGDRVRRRLFERAIDAGARDLPHARNSRQTITASKGGRECLAHRLDLLWAKGRLPSSAAILPESSSLSMVISPTLDFSRAISSSRSSRSRSFKAPAAPPRARSRHSVSLATETFICRATRSSGSPRNSRATIAILRRTEKRFGPFPSTPEGAPSPTLGERSGAPSGLRPSSIVMLKTPVEVQFYPSRVSQLSVPHPTISPRTLATRRNTARSAAIWPLVIRPLAPTLRLLRLPRTTTQRAEGFNANHAF